MTRKVVQRALDYGLHCQADGICRTSIYSVLRARLTIQIFERQCRQLKTMASTARQTVWAEQVGTQPRQPDKQNRRRERQFSQYKIIQITRHIIHIVRMIVQIVQIVRQTVQIVRQIVQIVRQLVQIVQIVRQIVQKEDCSNNRTLDIYLYVFFISFTFQG